MSNQKFIKAMTGYKATDANMMCRDFQFILGEWAEITGDIVECERGFHFCEQPSGVWAYYSDKNTLVFKVEAEDVLETVFAAGVDYKRVCRKIRLTEEIKFDGDWNTGDWNTGNWNTGYWNTGNRNTGYSNTGNRNTGDCNTGNRNTGNRNTGNWNTGDGNATSFSSGCFCIEEPKSLCFDLPTEYTLQELKNKFDIYGLSVALLSDNPIDFNAFKDIPNITKERLESLHKKHIESRKNKGVQ